MVDLMLLVKGVDHQCLKVATDFLVAKSHKKRQDDLMNKYLVFLTTMTMMSPFI